MKLDNYIFKDVDSDKCTLHVPSGTRWEYRHHDVFKRFKNIVTEGLGFRDSEHTKSGAPDNRGALRIY